MSTCAITPRGPFSLRESALFGFACRHETSFDGVPQLTFCREDNWQPADVALHQTPGLVVHGEGTCDATVNAQVVADIAGVWRPFRTWALVLLRAAAGRLVNA